MDIFETRWGKALKMEQRVAQIAREWEIRGWKLDIPLIKEHILTLEKMLEEIDSEILPKIPHLKIIPNNPIVSEPFKKDGTLKQAVGNWMVTEKATRCVAGPFHKIYWEPINLDSDDQVKDYLLSIGWKPTEYNYKKDKATGEYIQTSPKLTEESFDSIPPGLGEKIAQRMKITHRLGVLNGLLRDVRPDGRIESRVNTIGTPTFRMRHSVVTNIPKAKKKVFFGIEIRSCFIAKKGYKLVGVDAVGLENRWIAAWMKNPEVISIFTEGDFHEKFWKAIQEFANSRDSAKNIEYAYFFGAQNPKLGSMADTIPEGWDNPRVGQAIRERINKWCPGLDDLIRDVKKASYRGYLLGIDGRKLRIRSNHSSFNTLIQSSGAIMMKLALCLFYDWIEKEGLDAHFVGMFHDEFQLEVKEEHVERVKQLGCEAIRVAGTFFKSGCPMAGDAKSGDNWAQTH